MSNQNLFNALQDICGFIALQDDMRQIIDAVESDKILSTPSERIKAKTLATPIKERAKTFISKFVDLNPDSLDLLVDGLVEMLSTPSDNAEPNWGLLKNSGLDIPLTAPIGEKQITHSDKSMEDILYSSIVNYVKKEHPKWTNQDAIHDEACRINTIISKDLVLSAMSEHASNQTAKATAEMRKENEELVIMNDALKLAASWVSVEEKGLPFVDDYYLCYYSNEMDSGTAIMYYAPRIEHEWHHVTHWQPLPEKPKT